MLNQLIESKNNSSESARKSRFLLATFGVLTAVLMSGWTYSLFAKNYGVGNGDFDVSSLVSPVMVSEQAPPPRPEPAATTKSRSNKVVLKEIYDRVDVYKEPTKALGQQNVIDATRFLNLKNIVRGDRNVIPENATRNSGGDDQICGLCSDRPTNKPTNGDSEEFEVKPKPKATPDQRPKPPVSLGVINGKATYLPKPVYPPPAIAVRASGQVNVQVLIDEQGRVISAQAVSGHPLLRSAAVSAARNTKFSPTKLSNVPVKVTGVITYNFEPR